MFMYYFEAVKTLKENTEKNETLVVLTWMMGCFGRSILVEDWSLSGCVVLSFSGKQKVSEKVSLQIVFVN